MDVILRRVDDDFCDPLELRNDSMLGVPGLVEAVRAGNVTIANALGSGLLQSPAFMSFLPGLVPASARRGIETAVGRDLVVRPGVGPAIRPRTSRRAGREAGVPLAPAHARSRTSR